MHTTQINFEEVPYANQNLTFTAFEAAAKKPLGIDTLDLAILKSLNLYTDNNGYNNAAALLADTNDFRGIDLARFGDSISVIRKRLMLDNMSVLLMYKKAVEMFRDYYQYEEISGAYRVTKEDIPEEAFRITYPGALLGEKTPTCRNPILGNVLCRSKLAADLTSGQTKAMEAYADSANKPTFVQRTSVMAVTLPVMAT